MNPIYNLKINPMNYQEHKIYCCHCFCPAFRSICAKKRRMPLPSYRVDTSIFTIFILKTRLAMRRHFT
ncbi:MAG TPA: hypothetical protein VF677_15165, partial [Flavobacterium sp.]